MISLVISCLALAISLAPHVKRLVTRKRTTTVILGDGFGCESPRHTARRVRGAVTP